MSLLGTDGCVPCLVPTAVTPCSINVFKFRGSGPCRAGEERTFWDAPEVYMKMSPFSHAGKIAQGKVPLLLIHGENDQNGGTFPLQSERLFAALKVQQLRHHFWTISHALSALCHLHTLCDVI